MNERIKQLRKLKNLSQRDFGNSIGLSQNHISSLEKGVRDITERTIKDICRTYSVNKDWLIHGTGDMFVDILESYDVSDAEIKEITKMFMELDAETRKYISGLMKKTLGK